MKKHSLKLTLLALVLVLCLSTVVLAACNKGGNDNNNNNNNTDTTEDTVVMFNEIIDRIGASMSFGESFGTDISAAFIIDDKTAANKDVTYTLNVRGNVNGKKDSKETDTNFLIELVEQKGTAKKTLLGIAYEFIGNDPFFFVSIAGSEYKKINGYSLAALYKMTQDDAESAALIDANTIFSIVVPMLFGESGTVENNVYTLNFDLGTTVESILGDDLVRGLIEGFVSEEQIGAIISSLNLSYKNAVGEDVAVEDIDTLIDFCNEAFYFNGTIKFKFDSADKFESAKASFDYKYNDAESNFTLAIDKVQIGKVTTPVNTFEGFALDSDERESAQAFNALNFSLKGTAASSNISGVVDHRYSIEIQSDVDAFELLNLLNGTDKANILATLKKLGYFHLQIDELNAKDDNVKQNMIMLHSNFADGFAVLNFHGHRAGMGEKGAEVGLGGVYDFDALIDVIGMMSAGSDEPSEPAKPDIMTTIKKIIDIVKQGKGILDDYFTLDNIKENGVTFRIVDFIYHLVEMFGLSLDNNLKLAIKTVAGGMGTYNMNVKLATPTFGTCEPVETESIKCNIRGCSSYTTANEDFIKEITSIEGATLKVLENTDFLNSVSNKSDIVLNKAFKITGKNLKGETVITNGFIMGAKGLDVTKPGVQNVTLYVAIANDLLDMLNFANLSLGDLIPLYGTLKLETTVEVVAYANQAITGDNIRTATDAKQTVLTDSKVMDAIRTNANNTAYVTVAGIGTRVLDESLIRVFDKTNKDVTATAIDGGKFVKPGEYTLKVVIGKAELTCCNVDVETFTVARADNKNEIESIALGGVWTYSDYKITTVAADGTENVVTLSNPTYKLNASRTTKEALFDIEGNTYTLKKNLDFAGKSIKINYGTVTTASGAQQEIEIVIAIDSDYKITTVSSIYFMNPVAGWQVTLDGKVYDIVYNNGNWKAVSVDDATVSVPADFTLTWATGSTPVVLNADGTIKNYFNNAATRSNKINYVLTVSGYTYSKDFSAYELSASAKTVNAATGDNANGVLLDGNISYVNKIPYDTALEFKYGADGYGIYAGTTKVYDVAVTVKKGGNAYTPVNGKLVGVGVYTVSYDMTINGCKQTFSQTVTIKYSSISYNTSTVAIKTGETLNNVKGIDGIVYDGTLAFKYGKDGYGIYDTEKDQKIYNATVTAKKDKATANYELVNGTIAEEGKFSITILIDIDGVEHKVAYTANVTAAA